jgi:uncharacterized protein YggE
MSKMDNSVKITGIVVGAVVLVALIVVYVVFQLVPTETVQVNGVSTVSVVPDIVSINFNVETKGATAKEAKDANAVIVDAVIVGLIGKGYEREDIVTQGFNVYEDFEYDRGSRESVGFKAVHSIRVELSSDSDIIGETIDVGIDAGAMVGYINFELSRDLENEYKAEALRLATEDARIKAEAMAVGLGAKLGKIVSVKSSEFGYYPFLAYASEDSVFARGAEIETSIQPGERDVSGSVLVVYKLG